MAVEQLVDQLAQGLKPVRRQSLSGDMLLLALVCTVELATFFGLGLMRPDMTDALEQPSFWWRLASLAVIAAGGAAVALASFSPVTSPRRGLRWLAACVGACLLAGWVIDAAERTSGLPGLATRLDWHSGLTCVWQMVTLSLPAVVGLGVLMRRGAPTDRAGSALSVGVAAAAWGAFVFVFACPVDDPLYIAVWYVFGCGLVVLAARIVLPPLTRW